MEPAGLGGCGRRSAGGRSRGRPRRRHRHAARPVRVADDDQRPGDYLGGGLSYAYSTDQGDQFYTQVRDGGTYLAVLVFAADGSSWTLSFTTGAFDGPPLAPGTYSSSTPGVSMGAGADSRGCGTSTSTFTISDVVFGPYQYLE